jgi:type II secretory pathway predicted ATPase ExeA
MTHMTLQALHQHFGLHSAPFARAVPSAGLVQHRSFSESLARIHLAIESRTPALFCAEPGLGKSTLLGLVSDNLDSSKYRLVYTQLCSCGPFGLLGQLAVRYGLRAKRSSSLTAQTLLDEIARCDHTQVWVLDEAHRLPASSLDELRLLCNSDFDRVAPFALVLAGQPPLRDRLAEPEHASLSQRFAIRTTLSPLSDAETADYVERRMRAAGASSCPFRSTTIDKLFEHSRGVPRLINNYATSALFAAATAKRKHVEPKDVADAVFDQEHA